MNMVEFSGDYIEEATSKGREVTVIRGDDGENWGFHFGPEGDGFRFCLSKEAVNIMLSSMFRLEAWATTSATSSDSEPPQ